MKLGRGDFPGDDGEWPLWVIRDRVRASRKSGHVCYGAQAELMSEISGSTTGQIQKSQVHEPQSRLWRGGR